MHSTVEPHGTDPAPESKLNSCLISDEVTCQPSLSCAVAVQNQSDALLLPKRKSLGKGPACNAHEDFIVPNPQDTKYMSHNPKKLVPKQEHFRHLSDDLISIMKSILWLCQLLDTGSSVSKKLTHPPGPQGGGANYATAFPPLSTLLSTTQYWKGKKHHE
ncbi:hypothetical protein IV203_011634 [Nitzschia inconspicua]|uniref:Uncharacterized protein n=1 Tax=Nitzschia inconspicua TaxID=303405 RepID=A0A9K3KSQ5_9STRA|nr:hypothetical protein IV203_011634 [Nitzschia inconspicua]